MEHVGFDFTFSKWHECLKVHSRRLRCNTARITRLTAKIESTKPTTAGEPKRPAHNVQHTGMATIRVQTITSHVRHTFTNEWFLKPVMEGELRREMVETTPQECVGASCADGAKMVPLREPMAPHQRKRVTIYEPQIPRDKLRNPHQK